MTCTSWFIGNPKHDAFFLRLFCQRYTFVLVINNINSSTLLAVLQVDGELPTSRFDALYFRCGGYELYHTTVDMSNTSFVRWTWRTYIVQTTTNISSEHYTTRAVFVLTLQLCWVQFCYFRVYPYVFFFYYVLLSTKGNSFQLTKIQRCVWFLSKTILNFEKLLHYSKENKGCLRYEHSKTTFWT